MSRHYKYDYTRCKHFDDNVFFMICKTIEDNMPEIVKGDYLHDVDDSKIQFYNLGNLEIKVVNDYEVDAVYIDSDIELKQFF